MLTAWCLASGGAAPASPAAAAALACRRRRWRHRSWCRRRSRRRSCVRRHRRSCALRGRLVSAWQSARSWPGLPVGLPAAARLRRATACWAWLRAAVPAGAALRAHPYRCRPLLAACGAGLRRWRRHAAAAPVRGGGDIVVIGASAVIGGCVSGRLCGCGGHGHWRRIGDRLDVPWRGVVPGVVWLGIVCVVGLVHALSVLAGLSAVCGRLGLRRLSVASALLSCLCGGLSASLACRRTDPCVAGFGGMPWAQLPAPACANGEAVIAPCWHPACSARGVKPHGQKQFGMSLTHARMAIR